MRCLLGLVVLLATGLPASAQVAPARFDARQDSAIAQPRWPVIRIAKWTTLVASTGAVVYGFTQNRVADREYEDIERLCEDAPLACATKPGTSEYADPTLESRYQSVVRRDDRARLALLAGQVGLAASVLMFILDLPENATPDDIPYDPRSFRFNVRPDQLEVGIQLDMR